MSEVKAAKARALIRRYLLPSLRNFSVKNKLLYVIPVHHILRGYYLEDSGFDPLSFNCWAFVQPLYVPSEHLVFNMGGRLGTLEGGQEQWWKLTDENEETVMADVLRLILQSGEPRYAGITGPRTLATDLVAHPHEPGSHYTREALAYSWVLAGEWSRATDGLQQLDAGLRRDTRKVEWVMKLNERARLIRAALKNDRDHAQSILRGWSEQTASALRVEQVTRSG